MELIKCANWIRSRRDFGDICPIFRKNFSCKDGIKKATLNISAMGVYEAFVNGERIGDFIMAPGWTQYDKRHLYQVYNITDLLKSENVFNVTVGKGWYRSELITWRQKDIYGGFSAVITAIEIEYENGEKDIILSDKSWVVSESKIRFSEIYDGETYDAGFIDENWEETVILQSAKENLILQDGCIVKEQETLPPIDMFRTPKGELVLDFGQNMTGYISFEIDAKAGDRIVYSHAEVLDSDGNFYTENLRTAKQRVEYICKEGRQSYKPHHKKLHLE